MKTYKTITIGGFSTLSTFNKKVNEALVEISKTGELFDIKYTTIYNGHVEIHSAMIIYWVIDYDMKQNDKI